MPKRGGGTCFVTNTAGGCGVGTKPPFEINLGFNGARADHYALGHRPVALVGYDHRGRVIAHGRVPRPVDQRGIYPCKKPKDLGYGVTMCA